MVPCLQTHPATACSRPHRARRCAACRLQPLARLDAPNSRFSASCTARRFRLYVAHSARCDAVARMPAEGRHEPRQQSRSEDDALSQCLRSRFAERSREGAIVCSKLCKTRGERTIRRRAWGSEIESIKKRREDKGVSRRSPQPGARSLHKHRSDQRRTHPDRRRSGPDALGAARPTRATRGIGLLGAATLGPRRGAMTTSCSCRCSPPSWRRARQSRCRSRRRRCSSSGEGLPT